MKKNQNDERFNSPMSESVCSIEKTSKIGKVIEIIADSILFVVFQYFLLCFGFAFQANILASLIRYFLFVVSTWRYVVCLQKRVLNVIAFLTVLALSIALVFVLVFAAGYLEITPALIIPTK